MTKKECNDRLQRWIREEHARCLAEGRDDSPESMLIALGRVRARIKSEAMRDPAFALAWATFIREETVDMLTDAEIESFAVASQRVAGLLREKNSLLKEVLERLEPSEFKSEANLEERRALLRPVFAVSEEVLKQLVCRFGSQDLDRLQEIMENLRLAQSRLVETLGFSLARMEDAAQSSQESR